MSPQNFTHFQDEVYDIKWVIPTSWGIGLACGLLWVWPFGPMAKRTIEERMLARDAAKAANADQEKAISPTYVNDDEVIDPDDDDYVPSPAKQSVVSFHDTTKEPVMIEKEKSLFGRIAAATVNQGEFCLFFARCSLREGCPLMAAFVIRLTCHVKISRSNPSMKVKLPRIVGTT